MKILKKLLGSLLIVSLALSLFSCLPLGDNPIDDIIDSMGDLDDLPTAPDWSNKTIVAKYISTSEIPNSYTITQTWTFYNDNTFEYVNTANGDDYYTYKNRGTYTGNADAEPNHATLYDDLSLTITGFIAENKIIQESDTILWNNYYNSYVYDQVTDCDFSIQWHENEYCLFTSSIWYSKVK